MEFIHTYLGYNNNRDEYNCEILNEIKNPVGFCKYYKSNSYDDIVCIEFVNIGYEHRRRGYATMMVKELQRMYTLKWDYRFSEIGRKWYDGMLKKEVITN
jgi:hypothetical protein|tara:strand:+ start:490 stop:789 length:300 start_codon:yes stop_codon:yes gene_type:complete